MKPFLDRQNSVAQLLLRGNRREKSSGKREKYRVVILWVDTYRSRPESRRHWRRKKRTEITILHLGRYKPINQDIIHKGKRLRDHQ